MGHFNDFMHGTVDCRIVGDRPERFFNLCHSRNINLQNICQHEASVQFTIGLKDYKKIRPIVQKCHCVPKITDRRGLPFILHKNRRHKAFFVGIFLAALVIFVLSSFIWDIEITGNSAHTDEALTKYMKALDIFAGQKKSRIDPARLEEELRLAFKDISWVSARIEGTVLKIQLKEAVVQTPSQDKAVPGNVVAAMDGVISSMVTRTGTARVGPGVSVKAGDVLIEGVVEIYNDDTTVKDRHYVHGDGDVYGTVTYHCDDYYPAYRLEKEYTGWKSGDTGFEIFGRFCRLGDSSKALSRRLEKALKGVGYDAAQTIKKYRLTSNFYLPFKLYKTTIREYKTKKVPYTKAEMESLGRQQIEKKLMAFQEKGAKILRHNLKVKIGEDFYKIEGQIAMDMPLGEFRKFDNIEQYNDNDDRENLDAVKPR